jgi:tape measure domain-containing protein
MVVGDMEIRLRADIARLQRDMTAARQTVTTATNGMARAADAAKSALAGIGLGMGLAQVIQMSDQYTKFTAQLRLATLSTREYGQALASVKAISTTAQSSLADTGVLYAKIANGTRELGNTQKQVAEITEVVGLGLKVSGATAQEASSAMLQLSQSFASGVLRGEEFNAVNEAGPRVMLALAEGIGVPVGALKKMAEEGKLTSAVMSEALPRSLEKLRNEAKEVQTISGAFQVLKDRVMEVTAVRAADNGSVMALTQGIGLLSSNLNGLLTVMTGLTVVKAATWAAEWVVATQARIAANRALTASAVESAGVELRRAAADKQSALIAQSRAREATAAARVEVAADQQRMASAAAAAEAAVAARVAQFAETRAIVMAEIEMEKVRLAAQMNGIGRAARVAELARLSTQMAAINAGMAAQSTELAAVRIANEAAASNAAVAGAAKIAAARELETLATAGAAKATFALRVANGAMTASLGAAAVGAGILRGALALLGGPIGAIITVLTLGGLAWMTWGNKAKDANDTALKSTEETTVEMIARLDVQIAKLKERNRLQDIEPKIKSLTDLSDADRDGLARASARLNEVRTGTGEFAGKDLTSRQLLEIDILNNYNVALARVGQAQDEVVAAFKRGEKARVKEWFGENGTAVQRMNHELEEQKKKVGVLTPEMEKLIRAKYVDKGAATAIKQEASAYATLVAAIGEKRAANALELSGFNTLTDSQKLTIKLDEAIASGKNKVSASHIESARAKIAEVAAQERLIEENKFYLDQADENLKAAGAAIKAANDEADRNEELAKTFGMTKSAIELLSVARLEEQLAQATSEKGYTAEMAQLEALIDAKKRSAAAIGDLESKEASKKLADQTLEDQKKTWESIETTAHDTFVSIFDSGKSAFDRLRDTLKNGLLDLLYQMVIKKWVLNIGASVGMIGMSGMASAAGVDGAAGTGSASGLVGMAQSASNMYKAVTGGFSSMSTSVADAVQLGFDKIGASNLFSSAAPSVNIGTGITGNGTAASAAGSAASMAAAYMAGSALNKAISGQYQTGSGFMTAQKVATAVASYINPVLGVAVGAISGLVNRAFGMGDKNVTATGMSGTLSDGGLSGSTYQKWAQKGGWFRSDKSGTDKTAFDTEVTAQFTQGFAAIKAASAGFATSIGASTASLGGYSKAFDIALTKDAAANEKAIADFFTGVGDEIALRLVPNLAQFNKSGETMSATLQRLAGDFEATNQVAMLLGKNGTSMFGSLGMESATARERLVELAGGVSNLSTQATGFAQNFLTEAERLAPVSEAVATAMGSLGLASVTTREQFKTVVQGLDVTTAAGAQQFASLMALSDAFAQVHPAIEATTAALRTEADVLNERKDLQKQIDQLTLTSAQLRQKERAAIDASNVALFDQITALQNAAAMSDTLKTSIDSLKAFRAGILSFKDSLTLGSLSTLTPMQKAAEAQRQYDEMLAKAKGGDSTAQAGIQAAATAYLTANQIVNASSSAYVAASAQVQSDLAALAAIAGVQLSDAQQQLAKYDEQISQLASLNATASGIQAALAMPAPVMNWSEVGTTNMAPLTEEIKGLRADNEELRADNAALLLAINKQTDAVVQATLTAAENNAQAVTSGAAGTLANAAWKAKMQSEAN